MVTYQKSSQEEILIPLPPWMTYKRSKYLMLDICSFANNNIYKYAWNGAGPVFKHFEIYDEQLREMRCGKTSNFQ